jgi:hypothetical protein
MQIIPKHFYALVIPGERVATEVPSVFSESSTRSERCSEGNGVTFSSTALYLLRDSWKQTG